MPAASVVPQASFSDIDKELPDYLRLGIEFDAADRYIRTELPSPWNRYDETLSATEIKAIRKNYPPELSWIASSYGDRLTGYDLAEAVKVWLRANNAENQSVCEVLRERGWRTSSAERDGVGGADVFLSHVQAELPSITLEAMSRIDSRFGVARKGTKSVGSRIWVDFFSLRQWYAATSFKPLTSATLASLLLTHPAPRRRLRQHEDLPAEAGRRADPRGGRGVRAHG